MRTMPALWQVSREITISKFSSRGEARTRFVEPLIAELDRAGLGHLYEIADAEPPFTPRGCPFQAWSVGELLRAMRATNP